MKTTVKRIIRNEEGHLLIMALILLVVGGLILTPLLGFMSTGLVAGQVYEKKTSELYAADAGVEDAIWKIQNRVPESYPYSYPEPLTEDPFIVNDKSVDVVIAREDIGSGCHKEYRYQILSTATGADGGSTTVQAYLYVLYMDFSLLLDYAIISNDTVTLQPGVNVTGSVYLPNEDDLVNKGTIDGDIKDSSEVSITWPTAEELSGYYRTDVEHLDPYPYGSIDIKGNRPIPALRREGDLNIENTLGTSTSVLQGTVYVTGNLDFLQPGTPKAYTIDLNGHTIFVERSIVFPPDRVSISGSGCIIAVGNIDFQPAVSSEPNDFVLVMSIEGEVNFNPRGDFTGCIAGDAHVQLQPGTTLDWTSPEGIPLNFPMGDPDETSQKSELSIESWQIK